MRYLFSLFLCLSVSVLSLLSQVDIGGQPKSFSQNNYKSSVQIKNKTIFRLNIEKQIQQDEIEKVYNRYSVYKEIDTDLKQKGTLTITESGRIWQYQINSKNSLSLAIVFSSFILPEGASMFIYNPDKTVVRGAYTFKNNKKSGVFALSDFPGDQLIIEYFEPYSASFSGEIIIGGVGRAYKNIDAESLISTKIDDNINITCEQGNKYQTEKHAVAKMTFIIGDGGYLCTGALINNTKNDGALYFLTANHCISSNVVANTLVTQFNYERINCNGSLNMSNTLSGSILKATNKKSDFTLLLLAEQPSAAYKTYFAGWNISRDDYVESGFGIHHPGGDLKKIAIESDTIASWDYQILWEKDVVSDPNTHWLVEYNEGYTEGGSSGSPLFDEDSRIIGQLHGGFEGFDFYGKLTESWNSGVLSKGKLKPFLDPDNTGAKILDAYYPPENNPDAFLYTPFSQVCVEEAVTLNDGSAFSVDSWLWSFEPNTVQFLEGTSVASQSPVVSFDEEGSYDISLEVTNANGSDSTTRYGYIVSGQTLNPKIKAVVDTFACYDSFQELRFIGAGAINFKWDVIKGMEYVLFDTIAYSDTFSISKNDTVELVSYKEIEIQMIGYHGDCSDTITQSILLDVPDNDFIENAIELSIGDNGPFDNFCATVQKNEPSPKADSCYSQIFWCKCATSDTVIDNSVWFSFIAPSSGVIGIYAPGFDNQIAIYSSDNVEDIMSGDKSKYFLVAANDDYFFESTNYAALITNAKLISGKKYWLQVDGSYCGVSGEFSIQLYPYDITDSIVAITETKVMIQEISIFPNPVSDILNIKLNDSYQKSTLSLISIDGRILMEKHLLSASDVSITLPSSIADGLYFIRIVSDEKIFTQQIVVQKK